MGRFFVLIVDDAENYIKYLAWLTTKPKDGKKTRGELYKDTSIVEEVPEPHYAWLLGYASSCGLYQSNGMGISAINWQEIYNWQQVTSNKWVWLAETIKRLSRAYVAFYYEADDQRDVPSPLNKHMSLEETRLLVRQQFKAMVQADKELKNG